MIHTARPCAPYFPPKRVERGRVHNLTQQWPLDLLRRAEPALEPKPGSEAVAATADHDDEMDEDHTDLVVLGAPVARTGERVAARSGDLREAPVVITQGAQCPWQGYCWPCRRWR
jgi:hypothetical protein